MYAIKLEQFEGPLDLLLRLCEEEKFSISQISLAKIADQYCEEVRKASLISPAELVDFLLIASELLLIKSRLLVPNFLQEEEEPVPDLEEKLKIYRQYFEATKGIKQLLTARRFIFSREGLPQGWERQRGKDLYFTAPSYLTPDTLHTLFLGMITNLEKIQTKIPLETLKKVASLEEKINILKQWLSSRLEGRFSDVAPSNSSKIDIILYFLAVLELAKQRHLTLEQEELWGEIVIRKEQEVIIEQM
jgi:segregation and condensation protein A